jgi:hypothetical protein
MEYSLSYVCVRARFSFFFPFSFPFPVFLFFLSFSFFFFYFYLFIYYFSPEYSSSLRHSLSAYHHKFSGWSEHVGDTTDQKQLKNKRWVCGCLIMAFVHSFPCQTQKSLKKETEFKKCQRSSDAQYGIWTSAISSTFMCSISVTMGHQMSALLVSLFLSLMHHTQAFQLSNHFVWTCAIEGHFPETVVTALWTHEFFKCKQHWHQFEFWNYVSVQIFWKFSASVQVTFCKM